MRDRSRETSDYRALLGLMELAFELTSATEFSRHLVKCGRERSHFVESIRGHLHVEVSTRDLSRSS